MGQEQILGLQCTLTMKHQFMRVILWHVLQNFDSEWFSQCIERYFNTWGQLQLIQRPS